MELWRFTGLAYVSFMLALGLLMLRRASSTGDDRARLLGLGLLGIGLGDGSHVVGHVLADLYGGLPSQPTWADAYEAVATAVSITLATIFFLVIWLYSRPSDEELGPLGWALLGITALAAVASFANWAYLQACLGLYTKRLRAEGTLGQHPEVLASMVIAVLAMVAVGYAGSLAYLGLVRRERRSGLPLLGGLLLLAAVTFVLIHPFVAGLSAALRVITALKMLCLAASAGLICLSAVGRPAGG